jgi:hypothetical protein
VNPISGAGGVEYIWDDNGNTSTSSVQRLLSDGMNTYTYDTANRLSTIAAGQQSQIENRYSGLGDRLSQTVNGNTTTYTLDLNAGLTQVLDDGANSYLYGVGRIAQVNTGTEYFLGDALGSVRQLTNSQGNITLAKSYAPYGEVMASAGSSANPQAWLARAKRNLNASRLEFPKTHSVVHRVDILVAGGIDVPEAVKD